MKRSPICTGIATFVLLLAAPTGRVAESIWIEAGQLRGVRGSCFPDPASSIFRRVS